MNLNNKKDFCILCIIINVNRICKTEFNWIRSKCIQAYSILLKHKELKIEKNNNGKKDKFIIELTIFLWEKI